MSIFTKMLDFRDVLQVLNTLMIIKNLCYTSHIIAANGKLFLLSHVNEHDKLFNSLASESGAALTKITTLNKIFTMLGSLIWLPSFSNAHINLTDEFFINFWYHFIRNAKPILHIVDSLRLHRSKIKQWKIENQNY